MAMNFFKKVISFFSVIWNAISWRKNEKKGKQASQSTEEEPGIAENDPNSTMETEKSFVDIPLHSSGPVCAETPAVFTPCKNESDYGMKNYSSGAQNSGLEGNTCSSLSFFSEPIRDDSRQQVTIIASSKNENDEVNVEQVAIPEAGLAEVAIDEDGEKPAGEAKYISDKKTFPSDNPRLMYLDDPSGCAESSSNSSPPIGALNEGSTDAKSHSAVTLGSLPHDNITPITKSTNHNFDYSAIGDDIHLFDHDDDENVLGDVTQSEKLEHQITDIIQDIHSTFPPIATVGYAESDPRIFENNTFTASSSITLVPANDVSVAPTHHLADEKESQESCSTYSTNYMVKSDSLVNFLPESAIDPIVDDAGQSNRVLVLESANTGTIQEEEIDCTARLLTEGSLEEVMCTKKGILQLSGDHHCIDDMERPSDLEEKSDVEKVIANDLPLDTLLLEEPLLKTYHLEGCNLDEASRGGVISDDISTFQEILRSDDAAHEDCETAKKVDGISGLEQLDEKPIVIGGMSSKTVTRVDHEQPDKRNQCRSDCFGGNSHDHDVGEEGSQCSRKNILSQSRPFQLGEDTSRAGQMTRPDTSASHTPTMRYGDPPAKRLSTFGLPETECDDPFPSVMKNDLTNLTQRFFISSNNPSGFVGSWSFSETGKVSEMHNHQDPASFKFTKKQEGPILGIHGKLCNEVSTEESPCSQAVEDLNEFYPFIDCSSFLFRIPEEIRKETSFNPCVGSAPSRRSGFSNSPTVDPARFGEQSDGYEKKYTNISSLVPYVGNVPNFNPCLADEYKNTGLIKMQSVSEYSQQQLSAGVGTFWGPHPGMLHGDQQHNIADYPVACAENYEPEYVNVMSAGAYENDDSVNRNQADSYHRYVGQYSSAAQFPVLGIPYGGTQESVFLPREPLAPIIFPLHPVNLPQSEGPPSMISMEAHDENEQYPNLQTFWEGYSAHHIQLEMNKEHEKETSSFGIVRGLGGTVESLSSEAIDEDDDDGDNNTLPDPYFHMEENTSLHTVRSKADSFSGSLFCESLRSIISHNTDNEHVFPSFSCSSVQGCCPSVVMQSCETTLSNDSLPSVIVEETSYSKSVDEDYLATEKFMNDVNTALNESVMDQIEGRVDPLGNLLGRGDGAMNSDLGDDSESTENGALSRYSLGENISINNSKLTLLDGVLGSDSVARLPNLSQFSTYSDDISDVTRDYCRGVLDSVLEGVFIPQVGQSSPQLPNEPAIEANIHEIQEDSLVQQDNQELVIVHNSIIDGGPSQVRHVCGDGLTQEPRGEDAREVTEKLDVELVAQVNSRGSVERLLGPETLADEVSNRKGRRNKRRRKKSLDVDTKVDHELRVQEAGVSIGDGSTANVSEKQLHHGLNSNKLEDIPSSFAKSVSDGCEEATDLKPKGDGELFPNAIVTHDSTGKLVEAPPLEQEAEQHDDDEEPDQDEPGESSTNPSNNKRRRNRRKKRKN